MVPSSGSSDGLHKPREKKGSQMMKRSRSKRRSEPRQLVASHFAQGHLQSPGVPEVFTLPVRSTGPGGMTVCAGSLQLHLGGRQKPPGRSDVSGERPFRQAGIHNLITTPNPEKPRNIPTAYSPRSHPRRAWKLQRQRKLVSIGASLLRIVQQRSCIGMQCHCCWAMP